MNINLPFKEKATLRASFSTVRFLHLFQYLLRIFGPIASLMNWLYVGGDCSVLQTQPTIQEKSSSMASYVNCLRELEGRDASKCIEAPLWGLATDSEFLQYTLVHDRPSNIESDSGRDWLRGGGNVKAKWRAVWQKIRERVRRSFQKPVSDIDIVGQHNTMAPEDRSLRHQDAFSGLWTGEYRSPSNVPDNAGLPTAMWWLAGGRLGAKSRPQRIGELRQFRRDSDREMSKLHTRRKQTVNREGRLRTSVERPGQSAPENDGLQPIQRDHESSAGPCLQRDIEIEARESEVNSGGGYVDADPASSRLRVTSWAQSSPEEVPTKPLPRWNS